MKLHVPRKYQIKSLSISFFVGFADLYFFYLTLQLCPVMLLGNKVGNRESLGLSSYLFMFPKAISFINDAEPKKFQLVEVLFRYSVVNI